MASRIRSWCVCWTAVIVAVVLLTAGAGGAVERRRRASISGRTSRGEAAIDSEACTVHERGLVVEGSLPYRRILREHSNYCPRTAHSKRFLHDTMAYVTPWNNHGYDVAKWFNGKFTFLSPVWYQIRPYNADGEPIPSLHGQHDVDMGWLRELKAGPPRHPQNSGNDERLAANEERDASRAPRIVPRFHFDQWSMTHYQHLFDNNALREAVVQLMVQEVERVGHDGMVLDMGYLSASMFRPRYHEMIISLANQLHDNGKILILVIPAVLETRNGDAQEQPFSEEDFKRLSPYVDRFQLMTYDYSSNRQNKFGPSAPIGWVTESVLALVPPESRSALSHKLMVGINFYGIDYDMMGQGSPLIGSQLVEILTNYKPRKISWDASDGEHKFYYKRGMQEHLVYFPSLAYIEARLELAKQLDVGVAIWEVGQGLDYNFDLL